MTVVRTRVVRFPRSFDKLGLNTHSEIWVAVNACVVRVEAGGDVSGDIKDLSMTR